jgi:spermidine/putrescine transport system permease protein
MSRSGRIYLWGVFAFLYLPMALLMAYSFNESPFGSNWDQLGWEWYRRLADDPLLIEATLNSVAVALLSASLATVIGTAGAVGSSLYAFRGQVFFHRLMLVSLMSPEIVMGVSLLVLFLALRIPLGFGSLLLAHITFCLPFVTVTVISRLKDFDPRLIESARDLGASEAQAIGNVVLPLALPAILAGWLLSFTLSMDDVVVSFFVTGPEFEVLPLRIYSMVRMGIKPEVNALATLLFGLSLAMVILSQRLMGRKR